MCAAAREDRGLLREELVADARARRLAQRPDRAGDEDVAADGLTRVTGELDRGRVDLLELVVEEVVRELAPVRAEAVRLDQVGARVDEADVERDDRVGSAEIGLFRAAQAGHGARDQGSHPAVADDHRPIRKPFFEPIRHLRRL